MNLLSQFSKMSPNQVTLSILLGAISGIAQAAMIPLLLSALAAVFAETSGETLVFLGVEIASWRYALFFVFMVFLTVVTRTVSQLLLSNVSINLTSALRKELVKKVSNSSLQRFEKVGQEKFFSGLVHDIDDVVIGASQVPDLIKNLVSISCLLLYLLILNSELFFFVSIAIIAGLIIFYLPTYIARNYFTKSREEFDELQYGVKGLLDGFKELKLNREKKSDYIEQWVMAPEKRVADNNRLGYAFSKVAYAIGDMIGFVAIGVVVFILTNYKSLDYQSVLAVIMVVIYISAPIESLMHQIPDMSIASISLAKLQKLYGQLEEEQLELVEPIAKVKNMTFENVTFNYDDDERSFGIGPINFTLNAGEVTFLIGGNGSGKSTLSKVITQHYMPKAGHIYVNGTRLTEEHVISLRDKISSIYTDFHLFTHLLGTFDHDEVQEYLTDLGLAEKVKFEQGQFSTLNLSDGQRKRLALIVALMEDRDIYLLDEWAADQDPEFKKVFYRKILKRMKAQGKLIIVISHDDNYFDVADGYIVMKDGEAVYEKAVQSLTAVDL